MQLIRDIVEIYVNYGFPTEVLAASIRHPMHVVECAKAGADVATMPLSVISGQPSGGPPRSGHWWRHDGD